MRRTPPYLVTLTLVLASCADELGPCDAAAAQQLVYSRDGRVATKGQALLHDSCGSAATCHAANARGKARQGAPGGMNFDMLPAPTGWADVLELRSDIWQTVRDGTMPPRGFVVANSGFRFSVEESAELSGLPALDSREGKAVLRNWLACGAPAVADTRIPDWALPEEDVVDAGAEEDFSSLYRGLLAPRCASAGCHDQAGAGGLDLGSECGAYAALLAVGQCGGEPRVIPGDATSALLDKLEAERPVCGAPMPPVGPLPAAEQARIRSWVERGAPSARCETELP